MRRQHRWLGAIEDYPKPGFARAPVHDRNSTSESLSVVGYLYGDDIDADRAPCGDPCVLPHVDGIEEIFIHGSWAALAPGQAATDVVGRFVSWGCRAGGR